MEEFPSNSQMPKDEPKKPAEGKNIDPVVTGNVVRRKKPAPRRFAETLFGGDPKGVVGYVLMDVLLPAARDAMSDAMSSGFDRLLYGESRGGGRRHRSRYGVSDGSYTMYNRYSQPSRGREREDRRENRRSRSSREFDEIILATRVEADEVLERMGDLIDQYDVATVADLNSLVDISSTHIDHKWGWTDFRGADVRRTRGGGYLLELPSPEPID